MIKINRFKPIEYHVWSDSDGFISIVDEKQLLDIRIQCVINQVEDVYILDGSIKHYINCKTGGVSNPVTPLNSLDWEQFMLLALVSLDKKNIEKNKTKYKEYLDKYSL